MTQMWEEKELAQSRKATELVKMTDAVEQASFRMSYSESEKGLFDSRKF